MDETTREHLKTLHTAAIDARNGYREALENAEGKGMTPLFRDLMTLHERHAAELLYALTQNGEKADQDGSFMSTVHKTIMDVRSLFGGLDDSVLPGLIDGEQRNVAKYDEAIDGAPSLISIEKLFGEQRGELAQKISEMKNIKRFG